MRLIFIHICIRYFYHTLLVPCIVVVHPQSQLTQTGDTIVLSCDATGNGPIKYQWMRVNGEITSDRTEGVNTSTLTISPVTVREEDEYYCVVSSGGGRFNDTSNVAVIAVVEADPRSNTCNCSHKFNS